MIQKNLFGLGEEVAGVEEEEVEEEGNEGVSVWKRNGVWICPGDEENEEDEDLLVETLHKYKIKHELEVNGRVEDLVRDMFDRGWTFQQVSETLDRIREGNESRETSKGPAS